MDGETGGSLNFDSLEMKNASDKRLAFLLPNGGDGEGLNSPSRRSIK
jgi:hypothetical protein